MSNRYPLRNIPVRGQDYINPTLAHVMDLLNTWLPPTPVTSPDEMVIQQRSRRCSPTKHQFKTQVSSFSTDFQSFESPPRDLQMTTPELGDMSRRHAAVAGIRKRLLMSPDSDISALTKTVATPYKKTRKQECAQRGMLDDLRQELSALSNQQLIDVISNIAKRYSLQKNIHSCNKWHLQQNGCCTKKAFQQFTRVTGSRLIDLFATPFNNEIKKFVSPVQYVQA